jgi:hypothetical protein
MVELLVRKGLAGGEFLARLPDEVARIIRPAVGDRIHHGLEAARV